MLTQFEVSGFKGFMRPFEFQLDQCKGYSFNPECVRKINEKTIVNTGIIYGYNAVGKSNLSLAIFDLVGHITDKGVSPDLYIHYMHAENKNGVATFKYAFLFEEGHAIYEYSKSDYKTLVAETLYINDRVYASIDRQKSTIATINAVGAESLVTDLGTSNFSILSYIKNNSILADNKDNACFFSLFNFINGMLFFRSLEQNRYIGLEQGHNNICHDIIEHGNVFQFQAFLHKVGINYQLQSIEQSGVKQLYVNFNGNLKPFLEVASRDTQVLALFYYWLQRLQEDRKVSFLVIDEFDAFYHHELSVLIVEMLKSLPSQILLTTHNAAIISNDILRPDCYFLMYSDKIKSLADRSKKELREAHNIEKMYKAGYFKDEL